MDAGVALFNNFPWMGGSCTELYLRCVVEVQMMVLTLEADALWLTVCDGSLEFSLCNHWGHRGVLCLDLSVRLSIGLLVGAKICLSDILIEEAVLGGVAQVVLLA